MDDSTFTTIRRQNSLSHRHYYLTAIFCTFIICHPNTHTETPAFIDITSIGGNRYVAYISPDRESKPDTVIVSCSFKGIPSHSIRAAISIDSGVSWISIDENLKIDGNKATLRWTPRNDSINFSYFGERSCRIRIYDTASSEYIESTTFVIIGSRPLTLISPRGGETFSLNDTIVIHYLTNSDRISNIRAFFTNNAIARWIEMTSQTKRIDTTDAPIRAYTTFFIPLDYGTVSELLPLGPVRFLLKDYNSPLPDNSIESGEISLEPLS